MSAVLTRPLRPRRVDQRITGVGGTLGENLRMTRLGFAWLAPLEAWVRVGPAPDPDLLRVDVVTTAIPKAFAKGQDRHHWCWWEDQTTRTMLTAALRKIIDLDEHDHATAAAETFTMDDDGRRIA